jgi:fatty acid desaturase
LGGLAFEPSVQEEVHLAVQDVVSDYRSLTEAEKAEARQQLGIPPPTSSADLRKVWTTLLWILALIALGALVAGVILQLSNRSADAAWPIVTAVVGGLIGLLAPSPVSGK